MPRPPHVALTPDRLTTLRYFCSLLHFPPTCHCFWLVPYFPISERHKPSALLATYLCSGKLALGRPYGLKKTSAVLRLDSNSKLTSGWCAMRVTCVSCLFVAAFLPQRSSLRFPPFWCRGARAGRLWARALMLVAEYRSVSLAGQWPRPSPRHI